MTFLSFLSYYLLIHDLSISKFLEIKFFLESFIENVFKILYYLGHSERPNMNILEYP